MRHRVQPSTTRFVILRGECPGDAQSAPVNRASLVFTVGDRPGPLRSALVLTKHGLNMKKLESRPIAGKPEYLLLRRAELGDEALKRPSRSSGASASRRVPTYASTL